MTLYSKSLNLFDILNSFKVLVNNTGAKYMILVSFFWSLAPILDKICFKYSPMSLHGLIQCFGTFIILMILKKEMVLLPKQLLIK